jgi:excisionase family DNA binding protein
MTETDSGVPLTTTIEEAARLLGIGRNAAYEAAKTGQIPTIQIGRRKLVPVAKLRAMCGLSAAPASPQSPG